MVTCALVFSHLTEYSHILKYIHGFYGFLSFTVILSSDTLKGILKIKSSTVAKPHLQSLGTVLIWAVQIYCYCVNKYYSIWYIQSFSAR